LCSEKLKRRKEIKSNRHRHLNFILTNKKAATKKLKKKVAAKKLTIFFTIVELREITR
jgi:hypothetical protein